MKLLLSLLLAVCFTSGAAAQLLPQRGPAPEVGHPNPATNLAMGQWRFFSIGSVQVPPLRRQPPYLKFEARNHSVTGFAGCNRIRASYHATATSLSFAEVERPSTVCTGENYEAQIFRILRLTTGFRITGQELRLIGKKGVLAVLIRPHQEQTVRRDPAVK